jgi:hypothetical protein
MSGILEQLIAAIQANTAAVQAQSGMAQSLGIGTTVQQPVVQQPVVQQPVVQPAPASVSADDLMALITPHIGVETTKLAFGAAMRALGINALPEAQPHQYPALYTAFQNVIAQAAANPAVTAPAITSII